MLRIPRAIGVLAKAPLRAYGGEVLYDAQAHAEHGKHYQPQPSKELLEAITEFKDFLAALPRRNYEPVLDELLERSKKGIL
ncbi:unnamed protein product [Blepharisma stoltei]|uniref:Uncharacterized protein n=1 Tax=Blepharisma stoltei TaxID=1481888 RepID=A0AAU9JGC5_9CILI|nr:unnamed protein product [Blepharisma stoltei]